MGGSDIYDSDGRFEVDRVYEKVLANLEDFFGSDILPDLSEFCESLAQVRNDRQSKLRIALQDHLHQASGWTNQIQQRFDDAVTVEQSLSQAIQLCASAQGALPDFDKLFFAHVSHRRTEQVQHITSTLESMQGLIIHLRQRIQADQADLENTQFELYVFMMLARLRLFQRHCVASVAARPPSQSGFRLLDLLEFIIEDSTRLAAEFEALLMAIAGEQLRLADVNPSAVVALYVIVAKAEEIDRSLAAGVALPMTIDPHGRCFEPDPVVLDHQNEVLAAAAAAEAARAATVADRPSLLRRAAAVAPTAVANPRGTSAADALSPGAEQDYMRSAANILDSFRYDLRSKTLAAVATAISSEFAALARHTPLPEVLGPLSAFIDSSVVRLMDLLRPLVDPSLGVPRLFVRAYHAHTNDLLLRILRDPKLSRPHLLVLLQFIEGYQASMTGRLGVPADWLSPPLLADQRATIYQRYNREVTVMLGTWVLNLLQRERQAFIRRTDAPPIDPGTGHFRSTASVLLFQMLNQQLDQTLTSSSLPLVEQFLTSAAGLLGESRLFLLRMVVIELRRYLAHYGSGYPFLLSVFPVELFCVRLPALEEAAMGGSSSGPATTGSSKSPANPFLQTPAPTGMAALPPAVVAMLTGGFWSEEMPYEAPGSGPGSPALGPGSTPSPPTGGGDDEDDIPGGLVEYLLLTSNTLTSSSDLLADFIAHLRKLLARVGPSEALFAPLQEALRDLRLGATFPLFGAIFLMLCDTFRLLRGLLTGRWYEENLMTDVIATFADYMEDIRPRIPLYSFDKLGVMLLEQVVACYIDALFSRAAVFRPGELERRLKADTEALGALFRPLIQNPRRLEEALKLIHSLCSMTVCPHTNVHLFFEESRRVCGTLTSTHVARLLQRRSDLTREQNSSALATCRKVEESQPQPAPPQKVLPTTVPTSVDHIQLALERALSGRS
ncbi:hypothetical protein H696_04855 [Fonticula alba]|uniref:Uncharacterized protein n=1 Tax=Fonticula alba TaxID=691883 RepID=A0A058Z4Y0_FONAL|nr:hypothetical protein H696_04855 [Fonticula alba]KCV68562.1 hypothetical protein H696_04855 [Fonticula alba]|eukprot:XP_009496994.1 hypothetical protein H696_04855 [Fonticula alba]